MLYGHRNDGRLCRRRLGLTGGWRGFALFKGDVLAITADHDDPGTPSTDHSRSMCGAGVREEIAPVKLGTRATLRTWRPLYRNCSVCRYYCRESFADVLKGGTDEAWTLMEAARTARGRAYVLIPVIPWGRAAADGRLFRMQCGVLGIFSDLLRRAYRSLRRGGGRLPGILRWRFPAGGQERIPMRHAPLRSVPPGAFRILRR